MQPADASARRRSRTLQRLGLDATGTDPTLDGCCRLAAAAAGVPAAAVFLSSDRMLLKGQAGWQPEFTPLIEDLAPALHSGVSCLSPGNHLQFIAGFPVVHRGVHLGIGCVLDAMPRHITARERKLLEDFSGHVADVLCLREEIVRWKEAEQRALDIAHTSGDWLWETDTQLRVAWVCSRFSAEAGVPAAQVLGEVMPDREVLDGLGRTQEPPLRLRQLLGGRQAFKAAVCAQTIRGETRLLAFTGVPRYAQDQQWLGFRGSARDVTEQVQLSRAKLAAEQASRSKSEFLSRVSHELRTPLNAVSGFSQLMLLDQTASLPAIQRTRAEAIRQGSLRLEALIADMMDLARIEQGAVRLDLRSLDLREAVTGAVFLVQLMAAKVGVAIEPLVPDDTRVWADEKALGQILLNLLTNAIKYNKRGGRVSITAAPDGSSFAVEDTGVGLEASQLAQLFQPFNRLGQELGAVHGTGLGLVICRGLARAMGGELTISSTPGAGSLVTVRLCGSQVHAPAAATSTAPLQGLMPAQARQLVYIGNDEVAFLTLETMVATKPGWGLQRFSSGLDALGFLRALPKAPDVLLVDENLTEIDVDDFFHRLHAQWSSGSFPVTVVLRQADGTHGAAAQTWIKPLEVRASLQRLACLFQDS